MRVSPLILAFALIALVQHVVAEEAASPPDKTKFNLFNPTPDSLLRDLDTDRPDKTTSPRTVDAGHFQFETELFSFTHNEDIGIRTQGWNVGATELRIGLTNWADLGFVIPFYQTSRETDLATHQSHRTDGIGDLTLILKTNFSGNDTDGTATGATFFLKTPTASHGLGNGKVEGGVLFLVGTKLPGDIDFTFNTGAGITANDDHGYHADLLNIVTLSRAITGPVSAYLDFFTSIPTKHSSDWVATVDVGVLIALGKNVQIDAGINIGVTPTAPDLQPFLGLSVRF